MWRNTPPTADDVRQYQWWWNRFSSQAKEPDEPQLLEILALDVDDNGIITYIDQYVMEFDHRDWGDEWAPAIPPP